MPQPEKPADYSAGLKQFSKFLVVGGSNFFISFAVFFLLYNYWKLSSIFYELLGPAGQGIENFVLQLGAVSLDATLANFFGYTAGIINSFIWNKLWTFRAKHQTASQFVRFLLLNITCLIFSSFCLFVFTDYLNLAYIIVWFVTLGFITVINFVSSKYWVFKENNGI
jgi:putative flippase GtrA